MPVGTAADSLQGQGAALARVVAATPEIDSQTPPQAPGESFRELAVLPRVENDEGSDLFLSLVCSDGSRIALRLETDGAIAPAAEPLAAARMCMGRAVWPPKLAGSAE